ncbi:MAG: SAM-dependent methyltransferase [Pseudomonadota bacterium]
MKDIVPWGRSFSEYVAMFTLSDEDLAKPILGCGDGPASFNAELTKRGGTIVSVDPLYTYDVDEISKRIDETFDIVIQETRMNMNEFVWQNIRSIDELAKTRMNAMHEFLSDYPQGKLEKRYVDKSAPILSFPDDGFGLAVVSHFLFLYSDHLDLKFHLDTITELCRVCGEVRIFPLLQLGAVTSSHVEPLSDHFRAEGYEVEQVRVPYEFQRGGNLMLQIKKVEPRH